VLRSLPIGGNETAVKPTATPKKSSLRRFSTNLIINLNETPLLFEFLSGYSYDFKGATTVAGKSERSGWDKRQATIILYIMADGNTSFKPIVIFYGKGTVAKREIYNSRIRWNLTKPHTITKSYCCKVVLTVPCPKVVDPVDSQM
jgi:hypothetical protein